MTSDKDLWDRIVPEDMLPLTAELKQEIERRLVEHARVPSRASTWEEVRARLWSRLG